MHLTVVIPTYNRNATLKATLERLLPQLNERCKLLVLDNHSDVPVEKSLRDLLAAYPRLDCRIHRNCANLGPAANSLRGFELCDTEWIWLLGDDDLPASDAVATVLSHLDAHPDCVFFNFVSSRFSRPASKTVRGVREFVCELDDWSNLLFMSVDVYHAPTMRPNLRFGYHFAYSYAAHVAVLLASMGQRTPACFSQQRIIEHAAPAEWADETALLGKMTLLELPLADDVRWCLARQLRRKPSIEATAMFLLALAKRKNDWREAVYLYDQICSRVYYGDRSLGRRLRVKAYRWLVRLYAIGYPLATALLSLLMRLPRWRDVQLRAVTAHSTDGREPVRF